MRTIARINKGVIIQGDATARYRLASLTKQFTGAAVGLLAAEGKLSLSEDISTYLPEFQVGVKVEHLLNHSSGLTDYEPYVTQRVGDLDVRRIMAQQQEPLFSPGTQYAYSNGAYCLLEQIIEDLAGFERYLQRSLFAPLSLTGAGFRADEINNRLLGYALENGQVVERDQSMTSGTWGDGGLYMNMKEFVFWLSSIAADKGPWTKAHLNSGTAQVISPELRYAWGLFISKEGHLLHTGSSTGFSHAFRYDPYAEVGFVYFSNLADDHFEAFELEKEFSSWSPLLPTVLQLTN